MMSMNLSSVLKVSMGILISRVHLFMVYGTIWYLYPGNWARAGHTMAKRSINMNIFFIGEYLCKTKQARCRVGRTCLYLSGRRVSNPRPSAWEANALPTELLPHSLRCKCTTIFEKFKVFGTFTRLIPTNNNSNAIC